MAPLFDLFFIAGAAGTGQRLCVHHAPAGPVAALIVYLHPLAEEMNKSRRMAALQSRALAAAGCAVLQIDLQGCGDSSGDFADASWQGWLDDAALALQWLQRRHGDDIPVWFWGLRAGALLAVRAAAVQAQRSATSTHPHLLLWQPPAGGKTLLQQFLRLKTAADMIGDTVSADGVAPVARSGVDALRRQLQDGQTVDVAGYALAPALALGLDAAALDPPAPDPAPRPAARTVWLEVSTREPAVLLPASQTRIDAWLAAGLAVESSVVRGPAFWQTQEIEDAPALLQATLEAVTGTVNGDRVDPCPAAVGAQAAPAHGELRARSPT